MIVLHDNPLLLVFVVAAEGYLAGRIRIGGFGFGVAAVLFAGLAFGMADPQLKVPRSLWTLGLVLFVYTVGLAAGPGFVSALRRRGVGANVAVLVALTTAASTVAATGLALGLGAGATSGAYTGGLTNTPALAASLEALKGIAPKDGFNAEAGNILVGYSLGYPVGVTISLLAVFLVSRRRRGKEPNGPPGGIVVRTALVEPQIARFFGDSYRELRELDVLSISVGIALGLLLGAIEVPLPGGGSFALGFAGGPLIVGYATVVPLAMILKIILAPLLLRLLS